MCNKLKGFSSFKKKSTFSINSNNITFCQEIFCLKTKYMHVHIHSAKQKYPRIPTCYLKDDCDLSVLTVGVSSFSTFSENETASESKSPALKTDSMVSFPLVVKLFESTF